MDTFINTQQQLEEYSLQSLWFFYIVDEMFTPKKIAIANITSYEFASTHSKSSTHSYAIGVCMCASTCVAKKHSNCEIIVIKSW